MKLEQILRKWLLAGKPMPAVAETERDAERDAEEPEPPDKWTLWRLGLDDVPDAALASRDKLRWRDE